MKIQIVLISVALLSLSTAQAFAEPAEQNSLTAREVLIQMLTPQVKPNSIGKASINKPKKTTATVKIRKVLKNPKIVKAKKSVVNAFKKAKAIIHKATK